MAKKEVRVIVHGEPRAVIEVDVIVTIVMALGWELAERETRTVVMP